jgi:hypothetical protein
MKFKDYIKTHEFRSEQLKYGWSKSEALVKNQNKKKEL